MLNQNYTAELLNLKDVIVTKVENIESELRVYIELPRCEHICPSCGTPTDRVHDYRDQIIKDIPLGRTTYLYLKKRRYRCSCGKRFYEKNTFLPRYHRMTSRMIAEIIQEFRKLVSATEVASRYNVSVSTAIRYFDCVGYCCKELPKVLSIDEFKGNAGGEKYQSIITDPQAKKILDILPNRFEADLIQYFRRFPSRYQVEYFISDMNPHFRTVAKACFPNATLIADRYHVIRQAIWAMERVRKSEQKKFSARFRRYFKRSRFLLNKSPNKLTDDDMNRLALMFEISPKLADAYRLKNEFLCIMKAGSSVEAKPQLLQWLHSVTIMDMSEFDDCTKAFRNWFN